MARKPVTVFSCTQCGSQSPKWLGRCPDCNAWNSFVSEEPSATAGAPAKGLSSGLQPTPIHSIGVDEHPRLSSGMLDFDRVLGGGIVAGSVVLVGGEPGIGKSTLLLQVADHLAKSGTVLYVSGEESPRQIALRARRLNATSEAISVYSETSVERIIEASEKLKPVALVVDSIQTVHTSSSESAAGSVSQVRDSAGLLMTLAKRLNLPVFLIGHITKEGTIAGPKTLEHIVDTVLYFEGDRFQNYRLVRAFKNRFGPVNEIAIFRMHDDGLEEVQNPSAMLLSERSSAAGSAIVTAVEGTRPLLVEVQSLVTTTHFPSPKRMAMGLDTNRVSLLLAVVERKCGISFANQDTYVNVAGGLQVDEPAIDLAIIASLLSSHRNRALPPDIAMFGEVGLLGEIRHVSQADLRAREAAVMGFRRLIVPHSSASEIKADIEVIGIRRIEEATEALFGQRENRSR